MKPEIYLFDQIDEEWFVKDADDKPLHNGVPWKDFSGSVIKQKIKAKQLKIKQRQMSQRTTRALLSAKDLIHDTERWTATAEMSSAILGSLSEVIRSSGSVMGNMAQVACMCPAHLGGVVSQGFNGASRGFQLGGGLGGLGHFHYENGKQIWHEGEEHETEENAERVVPKLGKKAIPKESPVLTRKKQPTSFFFVQKSIGPAEVFGLC